MPTPAVFPRAQAIRLVADAEPRTFTVFLGAGASKSSGVPLGSEMIREWRQTAFHESAPPGSDFDTWCKAQPWFDKEDEYSILFEALFPDERARQRYMEEKIEKIFPGWGYLYLANPIQNDQFNVCFTTNFDDLIHQALSARRCQLATLFPRHSCNTPATLPAWSKVWFRSTR